MSMTFWTGLLYQRVEVDYEGDLVRRVKDAEGRVREYELGARHGIGRIKSVSGPGCSDCPGPSGGEYKLDERLLVLASVDGNGNITRYEYDERANMTLEIEAEGSDSQRITAYSYHPEYALVTSIERESVSRPGEKAVTEFFYDEKGNLLEMRQRGFSQDNPVPTATRYAYSDLGQVIMIDGAREDTTDITTLEYYPNDPSLGENRGMLHKIINPLGHEVIFSGYNAFGKPGRVIDQNGVVTTYTYDGLGRLIAKTIDGNTYAYEYDGVGNLLSVRLPGGGSLRYSYEEAGLLERVEDSKGNYIRYFYDREGNRIREEVRDQDGELKRYIDLEYDELNRLFRVINQGNVLEERRYDGNGNLLSLTDANGYSTSYDYDDLNRVIGVIYENGAATSYSYDGHDNLTSVLDPEGHRTSYLFDDLGNTLKRISPDTGPMSYTYDPAGNMRSKTDANGNTVRYTYDALNRLREIKYPDPSQNVTYGYDAGANGKGRLTGMIDPSGLYTYEYDPLGNRIREQRTIRGMGFVTEHSYDPAGNLTAVHYPGGRVVTYELDSNGRVTGVSTEKDGEMQILAQGITYLPFGPVNILSYGNGVSSKKTHDSLYRLTGIDNGSIYRVSYDLDPAGNILGISDNLEPSRSQSFTYDNLYRLTGARGPYGSIRYTYDEAGNRLSREHDEETEVYRYLEGTNRLIAVNDEPFTYDANANITGMGEKAFVYNQENRLVRASKGSQVKGEGITGTIL